MRRRAGCQHTRRDTNRVERAKGVCATRRPLAGRLALLPHQSQFEARLGSSLEVECTLLNVPCLEDMHFSFQQNRASRSLTYGVLQAMSSSSEDDLPVNQLSPRTSAAVRTRHTTLHACKTKH